MSLNFKKLFFFILNYWKIFFIKFRKIELIVQKFLYFNIRTYLFYFICLFFKISILDYLFYNILIIISIILDFLNCLFFFTYNDYHPLFFFILKICKKTKCKINSDSINLHGYCSNNVFFYITLHELILVNFVDKK